MHYLLELYSLNIIHHHYLQVYGKIYMSFQIYILINLMSRNCTHSLNDASQLF